MNKPLRPSTRWFCGLFALCATLSFAADSGDPALESVAAMQQRVGDLKAQIRECEAAMAALKTELRSSRPETMALRESVLRDDKELSSLRRKVDETQAELQRLKEDLHDRLSRHPVMVDHRVRQEAKAQEYQAVARERSDLLDRLSELTNRAPGIESAVTERGSAEQKLDD